MNKKFIPKSFSNRYSTGASWGRVFLFVLSLLILVTPAFAAIRSPAILPDSSKSTIKTLAQLNGKVYSLTEGPLALCPESLGFTTSLKEKSIQVFPLRPGANLDQAKSRPFLEIRNLNVAKDLVNTSVNGKEDIKYRRHYTASLSGNRIHSIVQTRIDDNDSITTNAEISFAKQGIRLVRWSVASGEPLQNKVECEYKEQKNKNFALR